MQNKNLLKKESMNKTFYGDSIFHSAILNSNLNFTLINEQGYVYQFTKNTSDNTYTCRSIIKDSINCTTLDNNSIAKFIHSIINNNYTPKVICLLDNGEKYDLWFDYGEYDCKAKNLLFNHIKITDLVKFRYIKFERYDVIHSYEYKGNDKYGNQIWTYHAYNSIEMNDEECIDILKDLNLNDLLNSLSINLKEGNLDVIVTDFNGNTSHMIIDR